MLSPANLALVRLKKRADISKTDPDFVRETFVDVANTMELLQTQNHQIVLGRRGSGKTHTLLAFAERMRGRGDMVVFLDLKDIGSNASVYDDPTLSFAERGSRMFLDIAASLHEELRSAVYDSTEGLDILKRNPMLPQMLDALATAATDVRLVGPREESDTVRRSSWDRQETVAALQPPSVTASYSRSKESGSFREQEVRQSGEPRHYVHFGQLKLATQNVIAAFAPREMWLLLDEWNAVPRDLQPYLGDLLRRALMTVRGLTVKVGAIQHRSKWAIELDSGSYIGLELGSEIFAEVNLDEFQVGFGRALAQRFFKELIYKHVVAELTFDSRRRSRGQLVLFASKEDFLVQVFTGDKAFEELVDSAEGVPRDGISIVGLAAQTAESSRIAVPHVRDAARRLHAEQKMPAIERTEDARSLMNYIVDTVIDQRKTRGFVVKQSETRDDSTFSFLVDQRLLHLIRRSIASHDEPGVRFDAYVVDYGFYVDRRATRSDPLPLELRGANGELVDLREVPTVDYRSVRKAVLSLSEFYSRRSGGGRDAIDTAIPGQPTLGL